MRLWSGMVWREMRRLARSLTGRRAARLIRWRRTARIRRRRVRSCAVLRQKTLHRRPRLNHGSVDGELIVRIAAARLGRAPGSRPGTSLRRRPREGGRGSSSRSSGPTPNRSHAGADEPAKQQVVVVVAPPATLLGWTLETPDQRAAEQRACGGIDSRLMSEYIAAKSTAG